MNGFDAVRRQVYGFALVNDIGPLFAVYSLLLLDNGLTAGQITTVFVIWAATAIVLEVPSGALADVIDRRILLAVAIGLRAVGIAIWLIEPGYPAALVGASLWALHSSLASGAWEALVHDQLTAVRHQDRYGTVMARIGQFNDLGIATAAITATAALAVGATTQTLGWITLAVQAISVHLIMGFDDVRWVVAGDDAEIEGSSTENEPPGGWLEAMRNGVRTLVADRRLVGVVAVTAVIEGLFVVDEYVPILARDRGASDTVVPVLVLVVWVGLLVGGEVAARRPDLSPPVLGVSLAAGAALMALAVRSRALTPLVLVGVGYAAQNLAHVIGDARLQERIAPRHRATITSIRSFVGGILATTAFVVIAAMSGGEDARNGLYVVLAVLAIAAIASARLVPAAASRRDAIGSPTAGASDT